MYIRKSGVQEGEQNRELVGSDMAPHIPTFMYLIR